VRLGTVTKKGHGALILDRFGPRWALLSAVPLFLSSIGALITEFSGIAGVGMLFGLPAWLTVSIAAIGLITLGLSHSYARVERIGILVGLLELAFIPAVILAHPQWHAIVWQTAHTPWTNSSFEFLLAANVGAVIMPWMIFYQQGAVIDKKLTPQAMHVARKDTMIGAVMTQFLMMSVIAAVAATIGREHPGASLQTVGQIAQGLAPFLGGWGAKLIFGIGILGAALIAAIVSSVAGAWGIAEVFRWQHSLNDEWKRAKAFYWTYSLAHIIGALLVIFSVDLVGLTVDVEVMNAMLLPIVLGFLLVLEATALPPTYRMHGVYKWIVWSVSGVIMLFGLSMIPLLW
ncbi:MAG: divalent metal cation transporter, partial [Firmicutes bacterium]|nr:divalent metal cation transporter [Bacillota bacterium]